MDFLDVNWYEQLRIVGAIGITVALNQMITAVLVTVLTLLLLRAARWFKFRER